MIQFGVVEDDVFEIVHHAKLQRLVHIDVVVEIRRTAQPIVAERQIGIPRKNAPFARVPSLSR